MSEAFLSWLMALNMYRERALDGDKRVLDRLEELAREGNDLAKTVLAEVEAVDGHFNSIGGKMTAIGEQRQNARLAILAALGYYVQTAPDAVKDVIFHLARSGMSFVPLEELKAWQATLESHIE